MSDSDSGNNNERVDSAFRVVGIGAGIRLLGTFAASAMGIFSLSLTVRLLDPRDYGRLALLLSVVTMASGLMRIGAGAGIARTAGAFHDKTSDLREFASSLFGFVVVSASIGTAALAIVALAGREAYAAQDMATALLLGLFLLGSTATWACSSLARGMQHLVVMEVSQLFIAALRLLALILLTVLALDTLLAVGVGLAAAGTLSALSSVILIAWLAGASFPPLNKMVSSFVLIARVSSPYAAVGLALVTVASLDVLVLGLLRPPGIVGTYEPALRLTDRLMQLPPILASAGYLPAAVRLGSKRGNELRFLYSRVSRTVFAIGGCIAAYLAIHTEQALNLIYGADQQSSPGFIWILLPGYVVNVAVGVNVTALIAAGDRRRLFIVGVSSSVMMVVSAFILIPIMGAVGAALATTLSMSGFNILASWHLYRSTRTPPWDTKTLVTWLSWFVLIGMMFGTRQLIGEPIAGLPTSGVLSAGWLTVLWWFGLVAVPRRAGVKVDPN